MFHSRNGLFFHATGQGNVRIIKTNDGKEMENMAKATRMRNSELATALRTIAKLQDDDSLAKWVLGVAAERLDLGKRRESMTFSAYHAMRARIES